MRNENHLCVFIWRGMRVFEEAAVGAAMYRMIACGEFKNAKELFSITREFNIIFKERLNRTDMVV